MSRSECLGQAVADESRSALDGYVRGGARQMLQRALECEVEAFLADPADRTDQERTQARRSERVPAGTDHHDGCRAARDRAAASAGQGSPRRRAGRLHLGHPAAVPAEEFVYVWVALREVYPATKEQRCWVHKTANVLNKMPKALQAKAKSDLHQIWLAETREMATKAFDHFLEKYGPKHEAACSCLSKDRDVVLAFYDFPAEHWGHLRTTIPIESTFSTIRLRPSPNEGQRLEEGQPHHDVQACSVSQPTLAATQRASPDRSCSRRKNLHRRSPAERHLIQDL